MIHDELHSLLDDYWAWLQDETELRTVSNGEYVEITAPFLDRHNDYLQIYARRRNSGWELTDDGYTLLDLKASGCDFSTEKRSQLLNLALKRLGVKRDGYALVVHAGDEEFAGKKHDLVQAMLAVDDLFHTATATVIGLFFEEVESWLKEHDVRFVEGVKFSGKSGYDYQFDFVIPGHNDVPERVLQAISRPDRSHVQRFLLAWEDTREVRPAGAQAVAVLNDVEQKVPTPSLDALANYKITPVLWSERDRYVEELAA